MFHRSLTAAVVTLSMLMLPALAAAGSDVGFAVVDAGDPGAGNKLVITDNNGVLGTANNVDVTNGPTADLLSISDSTGITYTGMGGECIVDSGTQITCDLATFAIVLVQADLGNNMDSFDASAFTNPAQPFGFQLSGGAGDDELIGGPHGAVFGEATLSPDTGDDIWRGGTDSDTYYMGSANDGNDYIVDPAAGSGEVDGLSYGDRSDNLQVRMSTAFAYAYVDATGEFDRFDANFGGISLGSGNDDLILGGDDAEVQGGSGNDLLVGGPGRDELWGGPGDDVIKGGANSDSLQGDGPLDLGATGNDTLYGEGGNDWFTSVVEADDGSDTYYGGSGVDTMAYTDRQVTGVTVTLDNVANDGETGAAEGDSVRSDVENVNGTNLADVLTGSGVANLLRGLGGKDTLRGLAGNDRLSGGAARDRLYGATGKDRLYTNDSAGGDYANCGSSADWANIDAGDTRVYCETVV